MVGEGYTLRSFYKMCESVWRWVSRTRWTCVGFHCAGGAKQALQDITDPPDGCFREGHISAVMGDHWTYCAD